MTTRLSRIFCEPCCGSAAVTVRLLQRYGKPPISYMGGKSGYADTILDALGLVPGQGCDGIVLADVGPWAAVWATLGNAMPPEDAAKWLLTGAWSYVQGFNDNKGGPVLPGQRRQDTSAVAVAVAKLPHHASKAVANIIRTWKGEEPRALWDRLKKEGWPSLMPVPGGRWLGPQSVEEVAKHLHFMSLCMVKNGKEGGYSHVNGEGHYFEAKDGSTRHWTPTTPEVNAERIAKPPTFPPLACYQGNAGDMVLPDCLDGWIMFFDPPYQGTSGYPFGTLGRSEVLQLAQNWHDRGAIVAISEAEPLPLDGWHHVQIDHARKGQKRTFSKQQAEWLTMNRPPHHVPAKQMALHSPIGRATL